MIYLEEQLNLIRFIQKLRGPVMDDVFRFLNFFDTDTFEISLVVFITFFCSFKWGIRFGFLLLISGILNSFTKIAFGLPRPFHFDPSLGIVSVSQFGFPSGGAQLSLLLGCLIAYFWKNRIAVPLGIGYALLISFSRLALGVHFPVDVIGGWVLGFTVFLLFVRYAERIEDFISANKNFAFIGSMAIAAIFLSILPQGRMFMFAVLGMIISSVAFLGSMTKLAAPRFDS